MSESRESILSRFREKIAKAAGHRRRRHGISAKCEEAGGIDLIVIYNRDAIAWPGAVRWRVCCPMAMRTRS